MASLLDMRRRIKSVKNTQQITKAMKMVAAAKLKRATDRVTAARPFAVKMSEVLSQLSSNVSDFSHPLLDARGDEKYLIVLVTADKGLCGGFNANLIKATQRFLLENSDKSAEMIPVGRKGRDFFRRRNVADRRRICRFDRQRSGRPFGRDADRRKDHQNFYGRRND